MRKYYKETKLSDLSVDILEYSRIIGKTKLSGFLYRNSQIELGSNIIYFEQNVLKSSKVKVYSKSNSLMICSMKIKFWNSTAKIEYHGKTYNYNSSFFGTGAISWKSENLEILKINQSGEIEDNTSNEELAAILIGAGIQLSALYLFFFILLACFVVIYII